MRLLVSRGSMVCAILALAFSGCSTNAGWQYTPAAEAPSLAKVPVNLAVERFDDQRATTNSRYLWVCVIPLVPYCTAAYNRPDTANGFLTEASYNFRPSEDLAQATAADLRQTGMFRDVFVTDRKADPGAPLVLRGSIVNTDWNGTRYGYLLGPYGSLLWLFGLPIGNAQNTLIVKLELTDSTTGRSLWNTEIDQHYEQTEGLYYNFAKDFGYPQIFADGIKPAIASLETFVANQPPNWIGRDPSHYKPLGGPPLSWEYGGWSWRTCSVP